MGKVYAISGGYFIVKVSDCPNLHAKAALWFATKWDIPLSAYEESIACCLNGQNKIPMWYLVLNENEEIVAGSGVIDNDFHQRKDLSPNICALYVEKEYRNQGIARAILDFVRKDMKGMGYERLYLLTYHTEFYERCGWDFHLMVLCDDNTLSRMYVASTLS